MSFFRKKKHKQNIDASSSSSEHINTTSAEQQQQTRKVSVVESAAENTTNGSKKQHKKQQRRKNSRTEEHEESPSTDVFKDTRMSKKERRDAAKRINGEGSASDGTDEEVRNSAPKPRGPRTAWTDSIQQFQAVDESTDVASTPEHRGTSSPAGRHKSPVEESKVPRQSSPARPRRRATDSSSPPDDKNGDGGATTISQMLMELEEHIDTAEQKVSEWTDERDRLQKSTQETLSELDHRVSDIEQMLLSCRDEARRRLEVDASTRLYALSNEVTSSSETVQALNKIYDKYSTIDDSDNKYAERLKGLMVKVRRRCKKMKSPTAADNEKNQWSLQLREALDADELQRTINDLLGLMEKDNDSDEASASGELAEPDSVESDVPRQLLAAPKLVQVISCRWKKDKRACGIVDVAFGDEGQLFAVDQHNKCVKVFNLLNAETSHKIKPVLVLGRNVLQKPSRISYVAVDDRMIVTDDGPHVLRVFSAADGSDLGLLGGQDQTGDGQDDAMVEHPVSCCMRDDRIAFCVDFSSKSLVVWNTAAVDSDCRMLRRVDLGIECPIYIAITAARRVAVIDSKTSSVRIYNTKSGAVVSSFPPQQPSNGSSSGSSTSLAAAAPPAPPVKPLIEPHGVCADAHGLVFVADRRDRSLRVLTERSCRPVACYTDEAHKTGIPFAIACNGLGQIAVADYVGTIRIFAYWEEPVASQDS